MKPNIDYANGVERLVEWWT